MTIPNASTVRSVSRPVTSNQTESDFLSEHIGIREYQELKQQYSEPGEIIVLDTETTGLEDDDRILSLSILDANTRDELFSSLIWPNGMRYWRDAERINHISYEMVRDAPSIQQVRGDVQSILDRAKILVSYNGSFDIGFLKRTGMQVDAEYQVDVMLLYADYFGEYSDYWQECTWQKLTTASFTCGIEHKAHDSMGDCLATLGVLEYMIAHPEYYGRHKDLYETKCNVRRTENSILGILQRQGEMTYDDLLDVWYHCKVKDVLATMVSDGRLKLQDGRYSIPENVLRNHN